MSYKKGNKKHCLKKSKMKYVTSKIMQQNKIKQNEIEN